MIKYAGQVLSVILTALLLAACADSSAAPEPMNSSPVPPTPAPKPTPSPALPNLGPAPDFNNQVWLNTPAPLNLAALRGKVVLVEFWTFG